MWGIYGSSNDEWHDQGEIVTLLDPANSSNTSIITQMQPYNLYQELGIRIK